MGIFDALEKPKSGIFDIADRYYGKPKSGIFEVADKYYSGKDQTSAAGALSLGQGPVSQERAREIASGQTSRFLESARERAERDLYSRTDRAGTGALAAMSGDLKSRGAAIDAADAEIRALSGDAERSFVFAENLYRQYQASPNEAVFRMYEDAYRQFSDAHARLGEAQGARERQYSDYAAREEQYAAAMDSYNQRLAQRREETLAALEEGLGSREAAERYMGYLQLQGNEDFAEKSRPREDGTKNGQTRSWVDVLLDNFETTGYDDPLYDYVNGDTEALNAMQRKAGGRYGANGGSWAALFGIGEAANENIPNMTKEQVATFNYLYETQGPQAAREYLDFAVGDTYTGFEALNYGLMQGSGLTSATQLIGAAAGANDVTNRLAQDAAAAGAQHPAAYAAGNIAGNMALMYGIGAAAGKGVNALMGGRSVTLTTAGTTMNITPFIAGAATNALTFTALDAVHNAGALASGNMSGGDFVKSLGVSAASGIAGGLAQGLAGTGIAVLLKNKGLMTPFGEFVRLTAAGMANSSAYIGTNYALREEKPSGEEIATQFVTAFAFSVLSGLRGSMAGTEAAKAEFDRDLEITQELYSKMSADWDSLSPAARAAQAERISGMTQQIRGKLNSVYLAGQQTNVDKLNAALDVIDAAMQQYAAGFAGAAPPAQVDPETAAMIANAVQEGLSVRTNAPAPAAAEIQTGSMAPAAAAISAYTPGEAAAAPPEAGLTTQQVTPGTAPAQPQEQIVPGAAPVEANQSITQAKQNEPEQQTGGFMLPMGAESDTIMLPDGKAYSAPETARSFPVGADIPEAQKGDTGEISRQGAQNIAAPEESTAVNDNPAQHTAAEQRVIEAYKDGADPALADFVERVRGLQDQDFKNGIRQTITTQTDNAARKAAELTGVDTSGYVNIINGSSVQHIDKRHGVHGTADHSMANTEDFARIGFVLDNFTDAHVLGAGEIDPETAKLAYAWMNSNNTPAPLVRFSMPVNGVYYVVEAVPSSKAKVMAVISAYMNSGEKKGQYPQSSAITAGNPTVSETSETPLELLGTTDGRVSHGGEDVNSGSWQPQNLMTYGEYENSRNGGANNERGNQSADGAAGAVPDRSNERTADQRAGGQDGRLGRGAAERRPVAGASQVQAANQRQNTGRSLRLEKISSRELGLSQGTDTPAVAVMPEGAWDVEMQETAARVEREAGKRVTFVLGSIPIRKSGGGTARVRGVNMADGIIIQADHTRLSVSQIADHEIYHEISAHDAALNATAEERITEQYGREAFDKVLDKYIESLNGIIDLPENATPAEIEAAIAAIKDEIMADAYAGINAFGAHAEQFGGAVNDTMGDRWGMRSGQNAAATDRTTGPPSYSYGGRNANRADSVKYVTNEAPTTDPDIRFSVDDGYIPQSAAEYAQMQRRQQQEPTKESEEKPEKKQRKERPKPVAESRPIIAKQDLKRNLLNTFSIPEGSRAEAGGIIEHYADKMLAKGELTQKDKDDLFDRLYAAGVMTVPAEEYQRAGREAVLGGRVYVNDSIKAEFGDDWNAFRGRAFAAGVYITNDTKKRGPDSWAVELAESFPGLFPEGMSDAEALEMIVQMAEEGKDEKMSLADAVHQYSGQEGVSEDQILDAMERELDWALRTFAEKAELEIRLRAAELQRRAKERERRKELAQRQREARMIREEQEKALKLAQWFHKNRDKLPGDIQKKSAEMLDHLDIIAIGMANEMNWSGKYQATWRDITKMVRAKTTKGTPDYDVNFFVTKDMENIVMRVDYDKIADMDPDELTNFITTLTELRQEYHDRNNMIGDGEYRIFSEVRESIEEELEKAKGKNSVSKVSRLAAKLGVDNAGMLTPMNYMERLGGWNPEGALFSMARQIEKGERDTADFRERANRIMDPFLNDNADWVRTADGQGKDGVWYEIEVPEILKKGMGDKPVFSGKTVKVWITPAMKAQLYRASKDRDSLRHIAKGGLRFPDKSLYSKGERDEAYQKGVTIIMEPKTVQRVTSDMTETEMELVRALDQYYNVFSRERVNKVSNIVYGHDRAKGYYSPIEVWENSVGKEYAVTDSKAENVGHMKARQAYAAAPIKAVSAFDAFERSVDQLSRFYGMTIPTRNWERLMRWTTNGDSTRELIGRRWGEEALKYIDEHLTRLQGNAPAPKGDVGGKLLNNYVGATFAANPYLWLKQVASYPAFAAALGVKNIPNPKRFFKPDEDLINTYTSELARRKRGYATPETALLKNNPNFLDRNKATNFLFRGGGVTAFDSFTVKRAWPWAENKVRREHPELDVGTPEQIAAGQSPFYKKVAEEFEEAVGLTQPMYDEMHRADIMKNAGAIKRAFTMFKTVPFQQYNYLRRAFGELAYAKRYQKEQGKTENERQRADGYAKKAANKAASAVAATLAATLFLEAINFVRSLHLRKGKDYSDDEGELTAASILEQIALDSVGDLAGMMVYGSELTDLLESWFLDKNFWGIEIPGGEQLNDVVEKVEKTGKQIIKIISETGEIAENGGDVDEYFRRHAGDYAGAVKEIAETAATYLGGFPVGNIEKYLMGTLQAVSPELYAMVQDYFDTPTKNDLKGLTGDVLKTRVGSILQTRNVDADEETAAAIAELYEAGFTGAMPADTPTSVSVNSEERKLNAYQKQVYDRVWSGTVGASLDGLVATETFQSADPEAREKMVKRLYDYAAERAKEMLFDDYEAGGQAEKFEALLDADLDIIQAMEIYNEYAGINADESMSASEKATAFSKWVDQQGFKGSQAKTIKDQLRFWSIIPADASRYEKLTGAGLDAEDAYGLAGTLGALEPEDGRSSVSEMQQYRAIAASDLGYDEKIKAIGSIMGTDMETESGKPSQYAKMLELTDGGVTLAEYLDLREAGAVDGYLKYTRTGLDYGLEPEAYIRFLEMKPQYDADGNGSYTQAEIEAAIDAMLGSEWSIMLPGGDYISIETAAALWQLANSTWKPEKNPYSPAIGQMVYDAVHGAAAGASGLDW